MSTAASRTELSAGTYALDTDASTITFTTRHMFGLGAVTGSFGSSAATVHVTDNRIVVDASISAASFASGDKRRDAKVVSAKFLDAEKHPDIAFYADRVTPADEGWTVEGALTVCGNTRPVTLEVSAARRDGESLVVDATTVIDRYAFGITAMKGMAARTLTFAVTARFTSV